MSKLVKRLRKVLYTYLFVFIGFGVLSAADRLFRLNDEQLKILVVILIGAITPAVMILDLRYSKRAKQELLRDLPPRVPEVPPKEEETSAAPKVRMPARTPAPRWFVTTWQIRVLDFGVLVYSRGSDKPALARQALIPTRADTIRPFAKVYVGPPFQPHTMRFLITDQHGNERYRSEKSFGLGDGQITILAPKRLYLGPHLNLTSDSTWMLMVELDGETIARQEVAWYDPRKAYQSGSHLITDGELAVEVESFVDNVVLIPTSLDELLRGDSAKPDADLR